MIRKILLLTALFGFTFSYAQKKAKPETFAKSITADGLKKQLYVVAGPEMEGRETATEGQRKAAAYIENHFKSLGLIPGNNGSFQMKYPVYKDSIVSSSLKVNDNAYNLNQDFQPFSLGARTNQLFVSEVVLVGHGIVDSTYDDYAGIDVRGKVVLILEGSPSNYTSKQQGFRSPSNFYAKINNAGKKGAAGVLIVASNFPRLASSAPGQMYLNLYSSSVTPSAFFISEKIAGEIIGGDWASTKEKSKSAQVPSKKYAAHIYADLTKQIQFLESSNVLGVLEGSDKKDEYVFITAHYDHLGIKNNVIYYGADDDGSGTVSVLELASAFVKAKAAGKGPRRTIVFMTVSGEEKGLWGSEYYSEHPIFPIEKTSVDLNIDMIGRIDPNRKTGDSTNYVYVVGDDKLSSDLKPISEGINKKYSKLELDYKFNDPKDPTRIYYRSDHYNFARKGVPIIFYFDGIHIDYHQPSDTPDKINYDIMEKRARFVFYTAWEMANRDDMLKRDIALPIGTR